MKKTNYNSNLTIFFSLPFYPIIKKNIFYNGHLALGLGDMVYQVYNPALLESNFFVSIMPLDDWLYKDSHEWACMDKNSKEFSYVHLYKRAETKRTAIYYVGLNNFDKNKIEEFKIYFDNLEQKFQDKKNKFHLILNNCATVINELLYKENLIRRGMLDFLPSVIFKRLVIKFKKNDMKFEVGKIKTNKLKLFKTHKFCYGLFSADAEKHMDNWINKIKYDK